ncbi:MAG: phosphatidate cytidylyltransferase [bacterium]
MKRIITAVAMAVIMIPILIWGNHYHIFDFFCLVLSLFAAYEFRRMLAKNNKLPIWIDILAILATGGMYSLVLYATTNSPANGFAILLAAILAIVIVFATILVFVDRFKGADFGGVITTILYCSLGFAAFAFLRTYDIRWVIYVLIACMVTDCAAYLFGSRFGKHKLIPKVSPKKSVEGAIAGTVIGTAAAFLYAIFAGIIPMQFPIILAILITAFMTVAGQVGDLVASKFKRSYDIKDYSQIFPGHGGVLDRFDSSMFAALFLLMFLMLVAVNS